MEQPQHHCNSAEKELLLLYYDELDNSSRELLQKHLDDCEPCRQKFVQLGETLTLLRPVTLDCSAADRLQFSNRLRARLDRRSTFSGFRAALVAVTVMVLAIIVPWQSDFIPGQRPIPPAKPPMELGIIEALDFYQNLELLELLDLFSELESVG